MVAHFSAEHDIVPRRARCGENVQAPQAVQYSAPSSTSHADLSSNLFEDGTFAWRNKMWNDVAIAFRYQTNVWRFIEITSTYCLSGEAGLRYSRECIQFVAACGEHVGRDDSNARRIEATRNGRARRTSAAKPRLHCGP